MRADILRAYPDLDPDRVHVVHNGIDTRDWSRDDSPAAADAVRGLGIDPLRPAVVFVAGGVDRLVVRRETVEDLLATDVG